MIEVEENSHFPVQLKEAMDDEGDEGYYDEEGELLDDDEE